MLNYAVYRRPDSEKYFQIAIFHRFRALNLAKFQLYHKTKIPGQHSLRFSCRSHPQVTQGIGKLLVVSGTTEGSTKTSKSHKSHCQNLRRSSSFHQRFGSSRQRFGSSRRRFGSSHPPPLKESFVLETNTSQRKTQNQGVSNPSIPSPAFNVTAHTTQSNKVYIQLMHT